MRFPEGAKQVRAGRKEFMTSPLSVVAAPPKTIRFKRLLLATDFSVASDRALRYATAIARHHGAKLYIAYIASSLGRKSVGSDADQRGVERAGKDLRGLEAELLTRGALTGTEHIMTVRQGRVWEQLEVLIEQEQVDLVVLGTHARSGLAKMVFGSVAEEIFRKTSCPALMIGPNSAEDWPQRRLGAEKTVLFATDFESTSLNALPYAVTITNRSGAKLILLHVAPYLPEPDRNWHLISSTGLTVIQDDARRSAILRLKQFIRTDLKSETQCRVVFGFPADGILSVAAQSTADIIVLGLHQNAHLLPSGHRPWPIAYEVVIGANCPVLTYASAFRSGEIY